MLKFNNAKHAIQHACAIGPAVVAWIQTDSCWTIYDPSSPVDGAVPEMLCIGNGVLPVPLSDIGREVLISVLSS